MQDALRLDGQRPIGRIDRELDLEVPVIG